MGAYIDKYWLMLVGRFVFGSVLNEKVHNICHHFSPSSCSLGGENLAVAQNNYAVLWFKGKELNMVFGLLLSVSRIVSVLCNAHHPFQTVTSTSL